MRRADPGERFAANCRPLLRGVGGFRVLSLVLVVLNMTPADGQARSEADLFVYAKEGRLADLNRLIDTGGRVDSLDNQGRSPLCYACSKGHAGIIDRLIASSATMDMMDRYGAGPLVAAVKQGRLPAIRALLKAGVDVNPVPNARFIPRHVAVENSDLDSVFLLLAAGADPLIQRETGDLGTDLVRNGMIRVRLRSMTRNTFVFLGVDSHVSVVFPVNGEYAGPVFETRDRSDSLVVYAELSGPIVPPKVSIEWALRTRLGRPIDPGGYMTSLLFPDGTQTSRRRIAIHFTRMTISDASAYGTAVVISAWLRRGADVNARNREGRMALMLAAEFGNRETAVALLNACAMIDAADPDGRTATEYANQYAPGQEISVWLENAQRGDGILR